MSFFSTNAANYVTGALVVLQVECHCNPHAENIVALFSPKFFQALQLRRLNQGKVHQLGHSMTVVQIRILRADARQSFLVLTVCLTQLPEELLPVVIIELKPASEFCIAEQVDEQCEGIPIVGNESELGVHDRFSMKIDKNGD